MRFVALATDYDGTLAHNGIVGEEALEAMKQLRKSGRRPIMVTGRILADLRAAFPYAGLFDIIVAENGAVLYDPATEEVRSLASVPPPEFVEALRAKGVAPLEAGNVIVATWSPHEDTVVETIRELGLDLTVIFNKGAVMVLPAAVNKASGLAAAADRLGISLRNIAGVGDAENDLAFLTQCEASAATANALDSVKNVCDFVATKDHGAGVAEFVERIIGDDLASLESVRQRRAIPLGDTKDDERVTIPAGSGGVVLAGTSGGGKSTLVTGFLERLSAQGYQFCLADPEGDYEGLAGAIALGDARSAPNVEQLDNIVEGGKSAVVSLLAVPQADRPEFGRRLFARVAELYAASGRPHWLIIDEAHHLLPAENELVSLTWPNASLFLVTTRVELVAADALSGIDVVIAVGDDPGATVASARAILGAPEPAVTVALDHAHTGAAAVWRRWDPARVLTVATIPPESERRRHARKYAEGELAPEKSFYFRGPGNKQNLRAQNLMTFTQLADGIDDETWEHHRLRRDYSGWMHDAIGDDDLSEAVRAVEEDAALSSRESRDRIIAAVRERYTAPA